ncbi:hypothetical protein QBC47DRAFT_125277 [Echria macrotheca]|uniref:Uncharacterized protein n=1 Tax=Echria macrotheca TaxID=438768 RepID=A0AAJ0F6G1_9PEZI|nr:hypothetical protein QBC47DRAFT_125277 [Echria macrotheca]
MPHRTKFDCLLRHGRLLAWSPSRHQGLGGASGVCGRHSCIGDYAPGFSSWRIELARVIIVALRKLVLIASGFLLLGGDRHDLAKVLSPWLLSASRSAGGLILLNSLFVICASVVHARHGSLKLVLIHRGYRMSGRAGCLLNLGLRGRWSRQGSSKFVLVGEGGWNYGVSSMDVFPAKIYPENTLSGGHA